MVTVIAGLVTKTKLHKFCCCFFSSCPVYNASVRFNLANKINKTEGGKADREITSIIIKL